MICEITLLFPVNKKKGFEEMKTIIHVNRHFIQFNKHYKEKLPVYTIKQGKQNRYAYGVITTGSCFFVDPRLTKPLRCGAMAWVETHDPVELQDEMTYEEVLELKKFIEGNK